MPNITQPSIITAETQIAPGVIVNSDINAAAAIEESKLAFATNDGSRHDHAAADIAVGTLSPTRGGTGLSDPTAKGLVRAQGSSAMDLIAPGSAGQVLKSDGTDWAAASAGGALEGGQGNRITHTGTTSETTLATFTLAAGTMGANGLAKILVFADSLGSAGDKTLKVKFGGTEIATLTMTAGSAYTIELDVLNRNSASAQVIGIHKAWEGTGGAPAAADIGATQNHLTAAVNTAANVTVLITGTMTNAGDTIYLDGAAMWAFNRA